MAQEHNTSRRTQGQRQAPSRRNDMNYCENCGEYYAKTYKRCPFCDERSGAGGRRAARTCILNPRRPSNSKILKKHI